MSREKDERSPEDLDVDAYFEAFEAGYRKGQRDGVRAGGVPPKAFGSLRDPATRDLFPVMAAAEPERLLTLIVLCRGEHQRNRRNGAPLGRPVK